MTKETKRLIDELIRAGERCSNACFNIAQGSIPRAHDLAVMRECSKDWDRATQEYRQAESMKRL